VCRADEEKCVVGTAQRKRVLVDEKNNLNLYLSLFKGLFGHLGINNLQLTISLPETQ
jgi:hypothetical protein